MVTPSGLSAQVGWKAESTYGTAVTPDIFAPFRSESMEDTYERSVADDIVAGALTERQDQVRSGNKSLGGSVGQYLFNRNQVSLMLALMGAVSTSGSDPYTHDVTPGALTGDSLTLQVAKPDVGGTMRAWTYSGVKVQSMGLSVTAGEYATVDWNLIAQDVSTGTAVASASYPSGMKRYHADDMSVSLGGTSLCARNLELEIANSFDDTRRCVGSALIKEPERNDHLMVSGSLEIEWTSLDHYTALAALTYQELIIEFDNGDDDTLTFTAAVRLDSVSQPVAGRGVVYQTLAFTASGASTDAGTIAIEAVNADSAGK